MIIVTWTARGTAAVFILACARWAVLAVREQFARAGKVIADARSEILPGPGQHQASRWPDEVTGIRRWSAWELAYLRGDIGELPCDQPDDCPLGPEPHHFVPPLEDGPCCCRQLWEKELPR